MTRIVIEINVNETSPSLEVKPKQNQLFLEKWRSKMIEILELKKHN